MSLRSRHPILPHPGAGLVALLFGVSQTGTTWAEPPRVACEHGICFRFPGMDLEPFQEGQKHLGGPWHRDDGCENTDRPCYCNTYWGADFDHCYRGHGGTDFMLEDAFRTMATHVPVVAPADGEVVQVIDDNYDRCHFSLRDLLFDPSHDGNYCGWEYNPDTGNIEERDIENNIIVMRHFNGRYYVYSRILHIMQDSVPSWIKDQLAVGIYPHVGCGEVIATVGSAGKSYAPHVHFEPRFWGTWDTEGTYFIGEEKPPTLDPYCGAFAGDGRTSMMWTGLLPPTSLSQDPEGLPTTSCQAPYDPKVYSQLSPRCYAPTEQQSRQRGVTGR